MKERTQKKSGAKAINSTPPTRRSMPSPSKQWLPWKTALPPPAVTGEHGVIRQYPFGQFGSAVLGQPPWLCCLPTSCLLTVGGAEREPEKAMTLCKHCSALGKSGVLSTLSHKSKSQRPRGFYEKRIKIYPSQTQCNYGSEENII